MSVLDELIDGARADLAEREAKIPLDELKGRAAEAPTALDGAKVLRGTGTKVICEVKRASPAKGPLAEISDAAGLADAYRKSGAAAISVVTEGRRFHGSLMDLAAVSARVEIPVSVRTS